MGFVKRPIEKCWSISVTNFLFYQKVDLGIADLSINYEREKAVDFTLPFMNTGINKM